VTEQLSFGGAPPRRKPVKSAEAAPLASELPVASVAVDVALPHLDRSFDYAVPQSMSESTQPGVRVRVRFAGKLVDGFVLARLAQSESARVLNPLAAVLSPEPVLTGDILELSRAVARRYAGSLSDVLRSAVPPRHATTEKQLNAREVEPIKEVPAQSDVGAWDEYVGGHALTERLARGKGPRAVWTVCPGDEWTAMVATLVASALRGGTGALVVVPDNRDVRRLSVALDAVLGSGEHVTLTAEDTPAVRYRAFLTALRGRTRVVVGTRAASFAPLPRIGLIVVWDDGDDSLVDARAPYWHAREVALMRSEITGCALVLGSTSRSTEAASLLEQGWAREVTRPRADVRARTPRVTAVGGSTATDIELAQDDAARTARIPHLAWSIAKDALRNGPVLVQVPRRGYVPSLACQHCRAPARCTACAGPLSLTSGHAIASCSWCGHLAGDWSCPACHGTRLRAMSVGERRTADELGRAFPGVPVIVSGRDRGRNGGRDVGSGSSDSGVVDRVDSRPALVVCTPGAEPVADTGYAAALLLDGSAMLARPDLRAAEETLRRWLYVVSLVRPHSEGGQVVVHAESDFAVVQALVRHDPAGFAATELRERTSLRLPPMWRVAELVGAPDDVASLLSHVRLPESAVVLGPVPVARTNREAARSQSSRTDLARDESIRVRTLVSVPLADGLELADALHAGAAVRSARKTGGPVMIRVDPIVLG